MSRWQLAAGLDDQAAAAFASLDAVFALEGELITRDLLSKVLRVEIAGVRYYVKLYRGAGKGLRRFLGRPRVQAEWQNLELFSEWGIPTAPLVAWGLERSLGAFRRGALITREIVASQDLAAMATRGDPRLADPRWVDAVSRQLAQATRILHDHHFVHNDLKWRNLLVDPAGQLFLIDCPSGAFWWGHWLRWRITKDLACLDKVAKYQLSRTQRLRFYLQYRRRKKLNAGDKRRIRKILSYFEGRE